MLPVASAAASLPLESPHEREWQVQATVRTFDPVTRAGTVLLDDGTELPFGRPAFDAGGLRLVRFGQRVRIEVDGAGAGRRVTFLTLATL
jgi:2-phospho-L-lactate/phosphoenolpyruvate guanylyltransferase